MFRSPKGKRMKREREIEKLCRRLCEMMQEHNVRGRDGIYCSLSWAQFLHGLPHVSSSQAQNVSLL